MVTPAKAAGSSVSASLTTAANVSVTGLSRAIIASMSTCPPSSSQSLSVRSKDRGFSVGILLSVRVGSASGTDAYYTRT
jgi:hypothetical protein